MAHTKEDASLNTGEVHFIAVRDFGRALDRAGVPTPLQEKVTREMPVLSPEEILGVLLDNLPAEKKAELERKGAVRLEEEIRDGVSRKLGGLFDEYLGEVARMVFGFNLAELSAQERMQIENIRKGLEIPGEFNPDGKRK